MHYINYKSRAKPEGQAPGNILRWSLVFRSFDADSQIEMWTIISLREDWEFDVLINHN